MNVKKAVIPALATTIVLYVASVLMGSAIPLIGLVGIATAGFVVNVIAGEKLNDLLGVVLKGHAFYGAIALLGSLIPAVGVSISPLLAIILFVIADFLGDYFKY